MDLQSFLQTIFEVLVLPFALAIGYLLALFAARKGLLSEWPLLNDLLMHNLPTSSPEGDERPTNGASDAGSPGEETVRSFAPTFGTNG